MGDRFISSVDEISESIQFSRAIRRHFNPPIGSPNGTPSHGPSHPQNWNFTELGDEHAKKPGSLCDRGKRR